MEKESKFYYGHSTFTRSDFYVYEEENVTPKEFGMNKRKEGKENEKCGYRYNLLFIVSSDEPVKLV